MARVELADKLSDARARVEAESVGDVPRGMPKFARLTRKEARVREDQYAALSTLTRTLMRRRRVKDSGSPRTLSFALPSICSSPTRTSCTVRPRTNSGVCDFDTPKLGTSGVHDLLNRRTSRVPEAATFGLWPSGVGRRRSADLDSGSLARCGGAAMTGMSTPEQGESLAEAGERIRTACPVQGATASNEECRIRAALVAATLAARGVEGRCARLAHGAAHRRAGGRRVRRVGGGSGARPHDLVGAPLPLGDRRPRAPHLSRVLPAR